jgi:hypothetical protein
MCLSIVGQRVAPAGVDVEVLVFPALDGRPAIAKAARRAHREGSDLELDHIGSIGGGLVEVGEEAQLPALAVLVQDVKGVRPGIQWRGVAFAEGEHLALDRALTAGAATCADGHAENYRFKDRAWARSWMPGGTFPRNADGKQIADVTTQPR